MADMAFNSQTYRVLIASPSDLNEEREAATLAVYDWNIMHAVNEGVVLLPVKWETHAAPTAGVRPQEAINHQLVKDSDIVVGMFWTKLGTATGVAESGTVEEIDQFVAAGKPTLLYFSTRPVDPTRLDLSQMTKLKEFKDETYKTALAGSFATPEELRTQLLFHLTHHVRQLRSTAPMPVDQRREQSERAAEEARLRAADERKAFERRVLHDQFYKVKGKRGLFALSIIPESPLIKPLALNNRKLLNNGDLRPMGLNHGSFLSSAHALASVQDIDAHPERNRMTATEFTDRGSIFAAKHWLWPFNQDENASAVIKIDMGHYEPEFTNALHRYLGLLRAVGGKGPWYVGFTLMRAQQTQLVRSEQYNDTFRLLHTFEDAEVNPDAVLFPADYDPEDEQAFMAILKPALDQFWQSYNYVYGAPSFDSDTGRYIGFR